MTTEEISFIKNQLLSRLQKIEEERCVLMKTARKSMFLLALPTLFGILYGIQEIHFHFKLTESRIAGDVLFSAVVALFYITTKPYELLTSKKVNKIRNEYKTEIIETVIHFYKRELKYYGLSKTHPSVLIDSGFFGNRIYESKEDDRIWGTMHGQSFIISEFHIRKSLSCIFQGTFGYITVNEDSQEKIADAHNKTLVSDYFMKIAGSEAQVHIKKNKVYIAIPDRLRHFEIKINKSIYEGEYLDNDINTVMESLEIINKLTGFINDELS